MCYGGCKATCENCRPKFVVCPNCGTRALLAMDVCFKCKQPISEEAKEHAKQLWRESHGVEK